MPGVGTEVRGSKASKAARRKVVMSDGISYGQNIICLFGCLKQDCNMMEFTLKGLRGHEGARSVD